METNNVRQNDRPINAFIYVLFSGYLDSDTNSPVGIVSQIVRSGKISSADTIKVMRINDDYVIAIPADELSKVDPEVWFNNIASMFDKNLPGNVINFTILSSMDQERLQSFAIDSERSLADARLFAGLHESFQFILKSSTRFDYTVSTHVKPIIFALQLAMRDVMEFQEYIREDDPVTNESDYITQFLKGEESGNRGNKKKKKKQRKEKKYVTSKVIRCAKSPKKAYKRHGVIVCKDKDAIKRDRRIIRDFIDDFIPGNAGWKKDLRDDLVDRWLHVYVISAKRLKRLERERKKNSAKGRRDSDVQRTIEFTRNLFNVPVDKWSDPTR